MRRSVLLITLSALLVRLAFCYFIFPLFLAQYATVGSQYFFDTYREIAASLLEGHGFRTEAGGGLILNRPPGYVLILLLSFPRSDWCVYFFQFFNSSLGAASTVLTFYLALSYALNKRQAIFASAVVAFWPFLIWETKVTVPENLLVALIPGFLLCAENYWKERPRYVYSLAAGLVLGMIMLTHGLYQVSLPIVIFSLLFKKNKGRAEYVWMFLFALSTCLAVSPWLIRNYRVSGRVMGIASGFGYHYFMGVYNFGLLENNSLDYFRDNIVAGDLFVREKVKGTGFEGLPDVIFRSDPTVNSYLDKLAGEDIKQRPLKFLLRGIIRLPLSWIQQQNLKRVIVNAVLVFPLLFLLALGLYRHPACGSLLTPVFFLLGMNMVVSLVFPEAIPMRYMLPLMPLVGLLSARGMPALHSRTSGFI